MTTIKISEGQYLKDVLPEIPSNAIIHKVLPNIGATTLEYKAERNSIIMEPNVPVIKGKRQKHILGIYEGVVIDDVVDYLSSDLKFKKLVVTPESFFKIKAAAEVLAIDIFTDYFFLFDECDRTIKDAGFRKKITLPIDDFFKFKNKSFISATVLEPSDPRFAEQGFTNWLIKPDFDYSKPIDIITTNNVFLTFKNVLANTPADNYCIFFNSTNMIGAFIKKMESEKDSQVFCSRESTYQLRISKIPNVSEHLTDFKKYNYFTSRFNSAVDIYMDEKPVVIIITDLNSAMHSMVYPRTESVQIVGRFRKGVGKVIHITNLNPDLKAKSNDEVKGWLDGCQEVYNTISALHKAATNPGAVDSLSECLKLVPYANFLNEDGSKNYFMQDNLFLEEEIKGCYVNDKSLLRAYKLKHFTTKHISESYPISDENSQRLTSGISMKDVVEAVIVGLQQIHDNSTPYSFDNRATAMSELAKSFPDILEAYQVLGVDELRKNGYSKKQIKKAMKAKKEQTQKSNYGLITSFQSYLEDGVTYPTSELKRLTALAINKNSLNLRPHITLLNEYFELGPRKTIGFDTDGKEVKGYKVVKCKFIRQ